MQKEIFKNNENKLIFLLTLLVFILHVLYTKQMGIMYVLDDEYGYWGNAAYFAGYDWSATVSKIPYYSFGYSLILTPLFWIFDSTISMYKAAIVLNGIMVSSSFLLSYRIAKKLANTTNKYLLIFICFIIANYPTYIIYSHIAWSECLLMLLFWLLAGLFTELDEESSTHTFILVGFLNIYMYYVHQRTLGILLASIFTVILMVISKRIKVKQFLITVIIIIIGAFIGNYIKNIIQENLWLNGSGLSINDYSGQVAKIEQLLTFSGLINALKVFIGQFFYLGVASYLLFYIGLFELSENIIEKVFVLFKSKSLIVLKNSNFLFIFLLISTVLTIAISIVFFINPISVDNIVYGRYNEIVLGPVLLIGLLRIEKNNYKISKIKFFNIFVGLIIITTLTYLIIRGSGLKNSYFIHTIGLLFISNPFSVYFYAIIALLIYRLIWISFSIKRKKMATVFLIFITYLLSGLITTYNLC